MDRHIEVKRYAQRWLELQYMPKFDDYQLHHVIPRSKANHPAIKAAGFDVDKPSNLIYLPKESGIHPTRSIHNGWNKGHADYNADITKQLDEIPR